MKRFLPFLVPALLLTACAGGSGNYSTRVSSDDTDTATTHDRPSVGIEVTDLPEPPRG